LRSERGREEEKASFSLRKHVRDRGEDRTRRLIRFKTEYFVEGESGINPSSLYRPVEKKLEGFRYSPARVETQGRRLVKEF